MPEKILIVDDDPDIRDILKIILSQENYEVIEADNGEDALKMINAKNPDLVLLDYKIPRLDGRQVCRIVKEDLLTQHLPIIMVTGKGDIDDKVEGIYAGADDYIVKPFEPKELIARIRMVLRHTQRDLEANPLTRLPGNFSILKELNRLLEKKQIFAVCYLDLDKFKAYNDKYGFERGDDVIRATGRLLIKAVKNFGEKDDFIGHIGGDDFVIITHPKVVDSLCQNIIEEFNRISPAFYNEEDRQRGYIIAKDRKGNEEKVSLLSISIGVVSNEHRKIEHVGQIAEIGAELKNLAKRFGYSNYVKDKRRDF
ncbi:MAG: response regulator [Candidatus Omnitrophica bacterium]|nr:response regulator [Candidatus Omnitrophota bacterium]